jgi:hypothetical protein
MSAPLPPISVLLDLNAILSETAREWQNFSRIGNCFVPQAVYEEIEFLCNRAPDPQVEQTAREFMRFYPTSGWQTSHAHATHASLTPAKGEALSKQARLTLATAECAYGLARQEPGMLVIFASTSQPLLQRISALNVSNLYSIPVSALLLWARTRKRPAAITEKLQNLKWTASALQGTTVMSKPLAASLSQTAPKSHASVTTSPKRTASRTTATYTSTPARVGIAARNGLPTLISSILALGGFAIMGFIVWGCLQPASLNQFLGKAGLPKLPNQQLIPPQSPTQ